MSNERSLGDYSEPVLKMLQDSGWTSSRRHPVEALPCSKFQLFPVACEALRAFGGLHVGVVGPGIDMATSDIEFEPKYAEHIYDDIYKCNKYCEVTLFPLGEFQRGHGFLLIDDTGRVYAFNEELELVGDTLADALDRLLLGKKWVSRESK